MIPLPGAILVERLGKRASCGVSTELCLVAQYVERKSTASGWFCALRALKDPHALSLVKKA